MKKPFALLSSVFAVVFLFMQCRHKPEKEIITGNPCHPDTVYFERDVLPLLISSCAYSGCHDVATALDGVILNNYENVMQTADVRPGNPTGSDLYEVLVENNPNKRMPLGQDPWSSDKIELVRKWILQGAKNLSCDEE